MKSVLIWWCFVCFFFLEIGAILLNLSTGEIEDKFHAYVRPTICPKLTAFCINLTGITQSMVDRQDAFEAVYRKFKGWIEKIQQDKNIRFASPTERQANQNGIEATFCTWSSFDLEFFFKKECGRLCCDTPSYFKAWIDARPYFNVSFQFGFLWIKLVRIWTKFRVQLLKKTEVWNQFFFSLHFSINSGNTHLEDANFLKH